MANTVHDVCILDGEGAGLNDSPIRAKAASKSPSPIVAPTLPEGALATGLSGLVTRTYSDRAIAS